ncbi:hypothetical protein H8958_009079 [Nasalis larvatus]
MANGTADVRKLFIFTTTQNYFGLMSELWDQPLLCNCLEINNFLDDGNQMLLRVQRSEAGISFSNTIEFGDTKDKVLVFFKLRPEVITDENLHDNILVSSMLESPISSLYQAVRQVFAPMLLKDQEWSRNFDPKLQNLLSELEAGLGIVLRRSDTNLTKLKFKEDDTRGILTPSDEFQFWIEQAHRGNKQISKERANYFKELFETIARPLWKAAVSQYEKIIAPAEQKIAAKLKSCISEIQDSPQQLLQAFLKYKELVKRPTISKELMLERETLLARLVDSIKDFRSDFENRCRGIPGDASGPLSGKNLSEVVNNIVWVRQLELKVDDTIKIAEALLSDLSGFRCFHRNAEDLLDQLKLYEQEQFDDWSRDIQSGLSDSRSGLCIEASSRIMELDSNDGSLKVHYSDRLVILLREVRQLSALGFVIPAKIQQVANIAQKFCKQAIILKQVAHFYNSIDQQMIRSQRPMMLQSALAFEQIIKVVVLMNIDLLRQQQRWKDALQELRTGLATVEAQGFQASDMHAWKQHWNHQLYKALEHQYQMGLEALNENLPEINIDLTYKQGRLQFMPPFEEIRAKYYREMKRFIGIPNQFKGVGEAGDESIFSIMIDRNASGFLTIFSKAEDLFRRLSAVLHQHKEWIVIGQVDMEALVEKHLFTVHDWEKNFKALKIKGKEVERLPSAVKVDCLNINCNPVKTVIDDLIQKLFDLLVLSLRKSIQAHLHEIDTFVTEAMEVLTIMPQSVEEIGDANLRYSKLQERKPEILPLFQEAEDKNRLLRTVAGGGLETISNLKAKWDKFELMMESHQLMIKDQIEVMKGNVKSRLQIYYQELEKFKARWDQLKPGDDVIETGQHNTLDKSAKLIKEKKIEFDELEVTRKKLVDDCHHFRLEEPNFSLASSISKDIESCAQIWAFYEEFQQGFQEMANEDWITFRTKTYLFEEFLMNWHDRLRKVEEHSVMTVKLQSEVDKYKIVIPILKYVRGEHLSPDHWLDLFRLLGLPRGTSLEKLLFGDLLRVADTIVAKAADLKDLNSRAQGEVTIREALRELDIWGAGAVFTLIDYEDSQSRTMKLIKDWKDIVNQVGDNRCLLQSLKDSPYYKGFEDKVSIWERKLAELDEYLQNLNHIQRKWVYLEPIFGRGALPKEQTRFNRVDEDFRSIMTDIKKDNRVTTLTTHAGIRNSLLTILDQLQRCINSVCFDEESKHIIAMKSLEGEVVPFKNKVLLSNNVETWLNDLALEMKKTLEQLLKECVTTGQSSQGAVDPSLFPSQILCLAEQIKFTEDVENAIKDHSLHQIETQLVNKLEQYTNIDTSSEDPGNTESGILELKLKALILDIIHNIDVVKQLNQIQVHTTEDWAWKKQLRFYMKSDHTCCVQMVDSEFQYTYEYQGNASKLVYTPLTDKCYLTLTQAMKMGLGGNPYGPAGTGKTESVKALGGLLGRQVLVFNCDEGIDVKSMGRIFVGLVKCGAWGCFDEFNRLEESVLSAVSMQIQTIQDALKNHRTVCELLGKEVEVNSNSGIFITMNPAGKGYGGRQKLPDNLKQLFRPVAMSRPDNELIAEVILYSEGFKDAKVLGRKLVAIFNLSRELLTPQQHYDWGLRALKTVLRGSGNLLRQLKKSGTTQNANESHIVVQALRLNTMSKFTFTDCTRFDALIKDVFPGIELKEVEYDELSAALKQVFEEANYEIIPNQIKKALELYEQLCQRMGVVIVGPSGAGKSTLWRMLRAALCKIGKVVKQYTINPKAMPRYQLLGHIDMDTREWSDGVLTNSARQVVREPQDVSSWIICDGDIDPEWIESLNSVLDDNRLLTMPSGERIQFGPNVNFVFETHDLSCASPATISRMGMIFLSDEETDLNSLIKSWLRNQPAEYRNNLDNWIGDYFEKALQWLLKQVFHWARESPPDFHKPMDTYYDSTRGRLATYALKKPENLTADDFSNGLTLPVIQTPDMQRSLDYFKPWLSSDTIQPFILVGPEGCGKGPKDCERLVLYLKDINLPKLDKWGTSTLVAFLQQVLTYQGFYDENLEWVGLENIQIVASMSAGGRLGRHKLTTRFTSIVRLCSIDYPEREQLQTIYGAYLEPVLHKNLKNHSIWGSSSKINLLAGSMVQVYEQVRAKFTVDDYSHYFFTPCILTQWVLGLFRYDLEGGSSNHPLDYVLEIVAYEARRLFRDKIVGAKELHLFDIILTSVFQGDWGSDVLDNMSDSFYVTWGARHNSGARAAPGQPLPPHGKPLGKLNSTDLKDVIKKGLIHYGRDNQNLDILLFHEVLEYMSRIDRVLSFPGGSLLLAGRSGVGRRTITSLVSHMHGAVLFSPKISRGYELKQFKNDLKHVLHLAGIEAQQDLLKAVPYSLMYDSIICRNLTHRNKRTGEVPGLYTLEELEPLLLPLKDQASQDGFFGPVFNYFTYRIQQNLHIVLIMDSTNSNFMINCESNPALHKKCQVLWMEGWSDSSMKKIPEMLLSETGGEEKYNDKKRKEEKKKNSVNPDFLKSFLLIHESCKAYGATPSRYMTFLHVYSAISSSKKKELLKRQSHLQAGVSKLNEAKALVDELNRKAGEQSVLLKTKQDEADAALQMITVSMQDASEQKTELERLKHRIAEEVVKIEERKNKIDDELKEVQPLVNEAKLAVGNIKPESLSEIRSLRMPPDVIRDILEGVLRLMGIFDTSWVSMKSFLAKRGVRDDIATFDARSISKEIRESVEELLYKNKGSFDPKNAKRASTAAAPLAAWVKANIQYSHVLERIQPLETEQAGLESNLKKTEDRKRKLEDLLNSVGQKVSELKEKFQSRTSEAAKLEAEVSKAQETIKAAEVLINQLDREHKRWNAQDSNFITALELAVRFGKTLIIQEMDGVEPVLYPLLRRDLVAQGLKEVSPLPLNLKRLYKETLEIEPILIIISPGADPSQELQELANTERSRECYHQVAMGQGQADLAIQMLKECARNGDWLCLKNLHLVVSWLPVLEKSPPGLKKNLMRTYESWTPEQISKKDNIHRAHALFSLAWFHAACQERRNYIPQGWTKFYEFSLSDLRAGYNIIDRLFDGAKDIQWEFVHGLLENAIYGGRIDNYFDLRVLQSYLKQFFNSSVIDVFNQRNKKSIFPYSVSLPQSCSILDYRAVIEKLPEDDKPSFFGLPANIAHSSQRMISSQVISQLRILGRAITAGSKFDREIWSNELSPVLNLWKKLNQNSNLIHQKVPPPNDRQGSPILSFIILEQFNAIRLVQSVHQSLAALSKVIRGTTLLSSEVQKLASALLNQKKNSMLRSLCDIYKIFRKSRKSSPKSVLSHGRASGKAQKIPYNTLEVLLPVPLQYRDLNINVSKQLTCFNKKKEVIAVIQNWVDKAEKQALLSETLDLSELFHPDTFLNALRQETARAVGRPVDSLKFVASWKGRLPEAKLQIKISGLLLEGCSFDGNQLSENQLDSPSVSSVLPCFMGWIPQDACGPYSLDECISLPVYTSAERDRVVTNIDVPCGGNQDQWIQCGAALFLKNQ